MKTRNLLLSLKRELGEKNVFFIETICWKRQPLQLLFNIIKRYRQCDAIIMLPAQKGLYIMSLILLVLNRIYKRHIYYDVIGGWLPQVVKKNRTIRKILIQFDGIWVETQAMKNALFKLGLGNVKVIYNFSNKEPIVKKEIPSQLTPPYKLCTFSRVLKEKGIEDAIEAVNQVNRNFNQNIYTLDIYGEIDECYKSQFQVLMKSQPNYIQYCGYVSSSESVSILKNYFALLFPTYYEGEGLAGTILDALFAGIPIVASDWKYNTEIVNESVGFIFPPHDVDGLVQILEKLAQSPNLIVDKKDRCLEEAKIYSGNNVIKQIICELEVN